MKAQPIQSGALKGAGTVCFIGDSITHAGSFHKIMTDVSTLRWPGRRRWVNCGISGNSAAGALEQFATDIAPHRPTQAFVMFGMNDGNYRLYERQLKGTVGNAAARSEAIGVHKASLATLVDRLRALGTRAISLISPTPYDQYSHLEAGNELAGYDDALAEMGAAARALAERTGIGFIDLHTPVREAVRTEAAAGKATYIHNDRMHPLPVGHLLMAVTILEALGTPAGVARTELHADGRAAAENATITDVTITPNRLEWTYAARALPCGAPADAWAAAPAPLQAAWRALNCETVTIRGLAAGDYELTVAGQRVVTATAAEWAAGVDLAGIAHAPQVVQAAAVCRLTEARHQLTISRVRNPTAARMFLKWDCQALRQRGGVVPEDEIAAARQFIAAGEGNPYILELYNDLLKYGSVEGQAETAAQLAALDAAIEQAAAIPVRQFVVKNTY